MEQFMNEINEMNLEQICERIASIETEIRSAENKDALVGMDEKIKALTERREELQAMEQRKADAEKLNNHEVEPEAIKEERKEETKMNVEVRSTNEYAAAFLKAIKTGEDAECRALLSTQVSGGQIPVPTFLETEIKTAWEENKIMNLVKKSYFAGNVKVGFELSATGASVHVEGTDAPTEEVVTIGSTELKAESIKKWITVSDEALEGTTVDTMGYLYKEIAQKIVEKAEEILIGKIVAAPAASTATAVGVPVVSANPAVDTILVAEALLSAQARNLNLAMNRQTYPVFVKLALEAGYAIDVFDGLKDKIVFTDKLPAFSAAGNGDTYAIVGDFGYGVQANFPNGNDITIKVDDLSLAEKDLVKIVGRQYVGMGVVAPKALVKIAKVEG